MSPSASGGSAAGSQAERQSSRFEAVIFDLFITLTDFDAERRRPRLVAELADALGVDRTEFANAFRASFTERATGALGDLSSILRVLCTRLGHQPEPDALARAVALRLHHERELSAPRDGVLTVLARLRKLGLRLGILTDCTPEIPPMWPSLAYSSLVDAVLFSCEVGKRKPHPSLYTEICERLAVRAGQCLYVGDGGSGELSGAKRAGMTAVLLQTPFGVDDRYDSEHGWDGLEAATLEDVVDLVVAPNAPPPD